MKPQELNAYEKYDTWCKSLGMKPADPEHWAKITGQIQPQPIAWAATKR